MIRTNLLRRLERLEEEMTPVGEPIELHLVPVDSTGKPTGEGLLLKIPVFRPAQNVPRGRVRSRGR